MTQFILKERLHCLGKHNAAFILFKEHTLMMSFKTAFEIVGKNSTCTTQMSLNCNNVNACGQDTVFQHKTIISVISTTLITPPPILSILPLPLSN